MKKKISFLLVITMIINIVAALALMLPMTNAVAEDTPIDRIVWQEDFSDTVKYPNVYASYPVDNSSLNELLAAGWTMTANATSSPKPYVCDANQRYLRVYGGGGAMHTMNFQLPEVIRISDGVISENDPGHPGNNAKISFEYKTKVSPRNNKWGQASMALFSLEGNSVAGLYISGASPYTKKYIPNDTNVTPYIATSWAKYKHILNITDENGNYVKTTDLYIDYLDGNGYQLVSTGIPYDSNAISIGNFKIGTKDTTSEPNGWSIDDILVRYTTGSASPTNPPPLATATPTATPTPTASPTPEPLATVIVDNLDSGCTFDSPWAISSSSTDRNGINYAHDGNTSTTEGDPTRWAKFTPNIIIPGTYNIYMMSNGTSGRPDAAPLEIKYKGGVDSTKTINQNLNSGKWALVGTYELVSGTDNYVLLSAADPGATIADAVRFDCIAAAPTHDITIAIDDTKGMVINTATDRVVKNGQKISVYDGDSASLKVVAYGGNMINSITYGGGTSVGSGELTHDVNTGPVTTDATLDVQFADYTSDPGVQSYNKVFQSVQSSVPYSVAYGTVHGNGYTSFGILVWDSTQYSDIDLYETFQDPQIGKNGKYIFSAAIRQNGSSKAQGLNPLGQFGVGVANLPIGQYKMKTYVVYGTNSVKYGDTTTFDVTA